MRSEEEIIDMLTKISDCGCLSMDDEDICMFAEECDCTDEACREQWKKWLNKGE